MNATLTNNIKLKYRNLLNTLLVLLLVFGLFNNIFVFFAFAICLIYFFFIPIKEVLLNLFFLMPFASIFKLYPNSTSLFTILVLYYIVLFFIKENKISLSYIILPLILFFYILVFGKIDLLKSIKIISSIILVFTATIIFTYKDIRSVILTFSIGLILSSLLSIFKDYIPNMDLYLTEPGLIQSVTRFKGLFSDSNYYSINLILVLLSLSILYLENKVSHFFYWISFSILSLFGIATLSRSFILTYLIILLISYLSSLKYKNKFICYTFFVIVISIYFGLNSSLFDQYFNVIINRFDSNDIYYLTSGRVDIWNVYLDNILNSGNKKLLFGNGVGADMLNSIGAHNLYIEIIYYFGLIGGMLYILNIIIVFTRKSSFRKSINNYIGIVILFAMYFFLGVIFSYDFPFQLIIIWLIFNYKFNKVAIDEV